MPYNAYSDYEVEQHYLAGTWTGISQGQNEGKIMERKAILREFAKNGLFNITKNSNGSAYFQNGIKLDLKKNNLIVEVVTNG